jgi:hypothetical protein
MGQNLISLAPNDAELADIDVALAALEAHVGALIDLDAEQRRSLPKMGDKPEAFCRQTLNLLPHNPQFVPPGLGLEQTERHPAALDALRSRTHCLQRLTGRAEDSEIALGSDNMLASLEGYALRKRMCRGYGLEALHQDIGARFGRRASRSESPADAACWWVCRARSSVSAARKCVGAVRSRVAQAGRCGRLGPLGSRLLYAGRIRL